MKRLLLLAIVISGLHAQAPIIWMSDETDIINVGGDTNNDGSPICVYGRNFGSTQGASTISLGGVAVSRVVSWADTGTSQAGAPPAKACFYAGSGVPTGLQNIVLTTTGGAGRTGYIFDWAILKSCGTFTDPASCSGSGYTPGQYALGFSGGGGSGAAGTYTVGGDGKVAVLNITNTGSGYTSAPTVSFPSGGGSAAQAVVRIVPPINVRATGSVHYVAVGGNDGNPGTFAAPWASPEACPAFMSAGDKCILKPGRYAQTNSPRGGPFTLRVGGIDAARHSSYLCDPTGVCEIGVDLRDGYAAGTGQAGAFYIEDVGSSPDPLVSSTAHDITVANFKMRGGFQVSYAQRLRVVGNEIMGLYPGSQGATVTLDAGSEYFFAGNWIHHNGAGEPAAFGTAGGPFNITSGNNSLTIYLDEYTSSPHTCNATLTTGSARTPAQVAADINGQCAYATAGVCGGALMVFSNGMANAYPNPIMGVAPDIGGCGSNIIPTSYGAQTKASDTTIRFSGTAITVTGLNQIANVTTGGSTKQNHTMYLGAEVSAVDVLYNSLTDNDGNRAIQTHSSPFGIIIGNPECNITEIGNLIKTNGGAGLVFGAVDPSCQSNSARTCAVGACTGIRAYNNVVDTAGTGRFATAQSSFTCVNGIGGTEPNAFNTLPHGTWAITSSGTLNIVGTGTQFTTDLKTGWTLPYSDNVTGMYGHIMSIQDDTHLTVDTNDYVGTASGITNYIVQGIGKIEVHDNTFYNCGAGVRNNMEGGVLDRQVFTPRTQWRTLTDYRNNIFVAGADRTGNKRWITLTVMSYCPGANCPLQFDSDVSNDWFGAGAAPAYFGTTSAQKNTDPLFASPSTGDFRLQGSSALLAAGVNTGHIFDVLGNPRSATSPSIGAFEVSAGCSLTYPSNQITVGQVLSLSPFVSNCGMRPFTYSSTGTALPTGLSLDTGTGIISGTASAAGTFTPTIHMTDGVSITADANPPLLVNVAPTITSSGALSAGTQGSAYSQALSTSGGSGALTCASVTGSLPTGLSFSGCTITGTPSGTGTSTFTAHVTDANAITGSASASLSITVNAGGSCSITTASLPGATIGAPYSQTLAQSGCTSSTWGGWSTCGGLALNTSTGVISGTPSGSPQTCSGTLTYSTASQPLSIVIGASGGATFTGAFTGKR